MEVIVLNKKEFPLTDVLSVTTRTCLQPEQISGLLNLLRFMTDLEEIPSSGFDLVFYRCRVDLVRQFPEIKGLKDSSDDPSWLKEQIDRLGSARNVTRLPIHDRAELVAKIEEIDEPKKISLSILAFCK
ncbi:hypothetical protein CO173_03055 [Candidatus Uhrbacteria bacterium CG_4_9_14_3_um_filter_41_35]|uniref:Uncharacterized protein n=1 Tax=Candidatus Uhrbacteria bacterium CG_4_9_14_3_um_filter_41_35 TaxID=1975034 RepID=A0A2M7XEL1_9BACT|nr:MAG: hypothetical protein COV92_00650 [Candidatus Uhrbacteria bacterium CG11_big_fil_rev_8_21_14_0_20_41_9]PJA46313.1 MAG: hypothetical protein CO173_03055 [Candidatus Uhrbacteria bacterium CG_4_9_14_3_um_filter_41_35]